MRRRVVITQQLSSEEEDSSSSSSSEDEIIVQRSNSAAARAIRARRRRMFDTEEEEGEEEEDSPKMNISRATLRKRESRKISTSESDSDGNAFVFASNRFLDEVPEHVLKAEMRIARDFSPLGDRLPRDFGDWFKIKNTPAYGSPRSRGVFATRNIADGTFLGE